MRRLCTCSPSFRQFIAAETASVIDFQRYSQYVKRMAESIASDRLFEVIIMLGVYGEYRWGNLCDLEMILDALGSPDAVSAVCPHDRFLSPYLFIVVWTVKLYDFYAACKVVTSLVQQ